MQFFLLAYCCFVIDFLLPIVSDSKYYHLLVQSVYHLWFQTPRTTYKLNPSYFLRKEMETSSASVFSYTPILSRFFKSLSITKHYRSDDRTPPDGTLCSRRLSPLFSLHNTLYRLVSGVDKITFYI